MEKIIQQLTTNQKRFYDHLKTYITKEGRSPTVAEMVKSMKFSSPRSVTQYLESLEQKGLIRRWRYKNRGIDLVGNGGEAHAETINIPVIASAGCDQLSIFAEQAFGDFICVDKSLLGAREKEKCVSIRAIGSSMDEAGVRDGDYVLVEVTEDVRDNDVVVAIVDNFAVIKKMTIANNAVILNPVSSDKTYKPIILRKDFKIFGKVIDIIRTPQNGELEVVPIYEMPETI
jgi:repressor LexA